MSIIVEAAAEGPKSFLQAKWLLFALLVYAFSSVVGEATISHVQVAVAIPHSFLCYSSIPALSAFLADLYIDCLPFPAVASQAHTRAVVCPNFEAALKICDIPKTPDGVCNEHPEPLRCRRCHCAGSGPHYRRCRHEDYIR